MVLKSICVDNLNDHLLDVPSLFIINEDKIKKDSLISVCRTIRSSEDNSITPIMVLTSNKTLKYEKEILKEEIEFYLRKHLYNK